MSQVIILEGEYSAFVPQEDRCRPCYVRVRCIPSLPIGEKVDKAFVFHGGKWHALPELVGLDRLVLTRYYGFRPARGSAGGRKSDV